MLLRWLEEKHIVVLGEPDKQERVMAIDSDEDEGDECDEELEIVGIEESISTHAPAKSCIQNSITTTTLCKPSSPSQEQHQKRSGTYCWS